ncbi:MAG: hypothetical protein IPL59_17540 [Candidatus Competibacteraceae bacterium]|nr:hypothetical protein [Candidatus Competibacteraceae bacterium]MBK8754771.1 hypothetical protein [Candidatus Competibacteraceae bacterium]
MLKSYEALYDHGQIHWISDAPLLNQARIIVTVLDENLALPVARRVPPPALKGSITFHDYDPFEPSMTDAEVDAGLDRTAQQIAGDAEAFRI